MVANSGATNHMFPDKSAFISYKLVINFCVRMGNNSYLPVLGCTLAIISLNGQRILVQNALHVPGLVVPLYSLCAHFTQPGCGFIGTSGVGILIYFPTFVLLVDTSKDCHLSSESSGRSAPLNSLNTSNLVMRLCFTHPKLPLTWCPNLWLLLKMTQLPKARMC
jgi:hypothetical protein